tara:strand:- start:3101 stop:3769 length:669 start_codon:yes stop_codon:yes gene_type:complete
MVTSSFINTKFTYYSILKKKLLENNDKFTVHLTSDDSCYEGKPEEQIIHTNFITWANSESLNLDIQGSTISVDEGVFQGFPSQRPINCSGVSDIWTHPEYWGKKQGDYFQLKQTIDKILAPLEAEYNSEVFSAEQKIINDEVNLQNEIKRVQLEAENKVINEEKQKLEAFQRTEDDRVFGLLSRLQSSQQITETSSSPLNVNTVLIAGGVGLAVLLLVGLKR